MYYKLIKNDVRKSKLTTAAITAFIFAAAALTALAASLTVNLFGAIDNMLIQSTAPHFMLMHTGAVDADALQRFTESNESAEDFQVLPFLNIEGADIIIGGTTLEESVQENGLTVQGERFDYLLDLKGNIIRPRDGEIYMPVYYMNNPAALGDKVTINGISFTIAGFLRDSTMNPALISSKRILVSNSDYDKFQGFGKLESLIEFRLKENISYADFQSDYLNAGLPANGPPPLTFTQVRMVNGITDGIMIAVLALIVILVTVVAFLCIRLTLTAKIEEDYKEIGVLKALGLRISQIKKLYIAKYGFIAGIACVLGFFASIPLQEPFMQNIRLYMGDSGSALPGLLCGITGSMLIYGAVMLYVSGVLRRFRKISAAQAVRFGAPMEKSKSQKSFRFSRNKIFSRNVFLGVKDVLSRKKLYVTMVTVIVISSFIMIVPSNIYNTLSDESFITYMGMGICDVNIGLMSAQTDDVKQRAAEIISVLKADKNVEKYAVGVSIMFEMAADDGTAQRMQVGLGDPSVFPITYSQGRAPQTESEIALSVLNAVDLEKGIGDEIVLIVDGAEKRLEICGIYSDVTAGGRTAEAIFEANTGDILGIGIAVAFRNPETAEASIADYKSRFSHAKVTGIDENIEQMLGPMLDAVKMASYAAAGTAALLTLLITALFLKMLIAKDRYSIVIFKSLGFTSADIRVQYLTRAAAALVLGVIIGTILANTLGEYVGIAIVSVFGASAFDFIINPLFAYILSPIVIAACVYAAAMLGITDIRNMRISEHIKEA